MENKKQKPLKSAKGNHKMALGLGITALAAAAAGAAFLYGTEKGAAKRKELKNWMLGMKADVIKGMESMKEWSEASYHEIIDEVAQKYKGIKSIDSAELTAAVNDLKKHWKNIKKQVDSVGKEK